VSTVSEDAALTWLSFSLGCIQDPPQFAADALFATLTASDAAPPRPAAPARPLAPGSTPPVVSKETAAPKTAAAPESSS
jgi:hypothetical protein